MTKPEDLIRELKCARARKDFFEFCRLMIPSFYKKERRHLRELCRLLQDLIEDRLTNDQGQTVSKLMINLPPRHGKSLTLQLFEAWSLGRDPSQSFMTICYNETLSGRFSKAVRNMIEETRLDDRFVFSDVFPDVKIKKGDGSFQLWSVEGSHFSYLGGSFGSTITGLGCSVGVIDDPIKNKEEAVNDRVTQSHFDFYTDTFLSRIEEGGKQIVNMTRWSDHDLCGRLLDLEPDKWTVVVFQAYDEESDQMLCPELLSLETYLDKKSKMSEEILSANYQQITVNKKGALYQTFNTYSGREVDGVSKVYIDTADKGEDFLSAVFYTETPEGEAYIKDVIFTRDPQEITEPLVSEAIKRNETTEAKIESNNGGRAFARNVERLTRDLGFLSCQFVSFNQNKNKVARILSRSSDVQRLVFYPETWSEDFPEFYRQTTGYQRTGKNKHDDAPDCLTGIVESIESGGFFVY
jgi:predicted phage terminase large subunit-like protein